MKLKRRAASMEDSGAGAGAAAAAAAAGSPRLACMVCGASLDGMDAHARDAHVNRCIDGRRSPTGGDAGAVGACACAVCGRDLTGCEWLNDARAPPYTPSPPPPPPPPPRPHH